MTEDSFQKFDELCAGYVLNTLNSREHQEFENLLAKADNNQLKKYRYMRSAANHLAFAVKGTEPPEYVKNNIMTQIQSGFDDSKDERTDIIVSRGRGVKQQSASEQKDQETNWLFFAVAASIALLILCLSLVFYSFNLSSQINQHEETINEQQQIITELEQEIRYKNELLSVLESTDISIITLRGMESNPNGFGKIIQGSDTGATLIQVSNMQPVPEDSLYQVWIIRNNKYISAGTFEVNDAGNGFSRMDQGEDFNIRATDTFTVTLEPEGGSLQPTGDTYLMGSNGNRQ